MNFKGYIDRLKRCKGLTDLNCPTKSCRQCLSILFLLHYVTHQIQRGTQEAEVDVAEKIRQNYKHLNVNLNVKLLTFLLGCKVVCILNTVKI